MNRVTAEPRRPRWGLALAALAITMLLWSGNTIVARSVRDDIPPFMLALVRWTGAFLIVLPFALRHLAADREKLVAHWPVVLALGLTGVASFNAFLYSGLQYTTATNASLLQAATVSSDASCSSASRSAGDQTCSSIAMTRATLLSGVGTPASSGGLTS